MISSTRSMRYRRVCTGLVLLTAAWLPNVFADDDHQESGATGFLPSGSPDTSSAFTIRDAVWKSEKRQLIVTGERNSDLAITLVNASDPGQLLGRDGDDEDDWRVRSRRPSPVPCRVRAISEDGNSIETAVRRAPSNCGPSGQPENRPPVADAGPDQHLILPVGARELSVTLDASASSDSDGDIVVWNWSGIPDPANLIHPALSLGVGNHSFTLMVTDDEGATSVADSVSVSIDPPVIGGDPHLTITDYKGPATCVACHEIEAQQMHGSVHYQQSGPTDYLTNLALPAGERWNGASGDGYSGINTYCGAHDNSPRFTCAGCHVGNGRFPKPEDVLLAMNDADQRKELANIDCLMCHQEKYKRFPDPTPDSLDGQPPFEVLKIVAPNPSTGKPDPSQPPILRSGLEGIPMVDSVTKDFDFVPADPTNLALAGAPVTLMDISAVEAAQTVHATTRKSCLNCHAKAGGGDGTKRGDLSSLLADPDPHIDYHMSDAGAGLVCADCHAAGGHRVIGRGVDLRPNDVPGRLTCEGCHGDRPHQDYDASDGRARDTHAMRVACQSCHIPTFAKGIATEVARDWEDPHWSDAACNGRGGWLPREDKLADLIPTYQWFDGTSEVYYLSEPLAGVPRIQLDASNNTLGLSEAYMLGIPNGAVNSPGAKLHPMKEHLGKVARNQTTDTLIAHSTFEFFRTGSFEQAILSGRKQTDGMSETDHYEVVGVHTYQGINHGVEGKDSALACGACHAGLSGGPLRMDLQGALGYELKASKEDVCKQCHGEKEPMSFLKLHDKHVKDKRRDCSTCHNFTRPERRLSTALSSED